MFVPFACLVFGCAFVKAASHVRFCDCGDNYRSVAKNGVDWMGDATFILAFVVVSVVRFRDGCGPPCGTLL